MSNPEINGRCHDALMNNCNDPSLSIGAPACNNKTLVIKGLCVDCSNRNLTEVPCLTGSTQDVIAAGTQVYLIDRNPRIKQLPTRAFATQPGQGSRSSTPLLTLNISGIGIDQLGPTSIGGIAAASCPALFSAANLNLTAGIAEDTFSGWLKIKLFDMHGTIFNTQKKYRSVPLRYAFSQMSIQGSMYFNAASFPSGVSFLFQLEMSFPLLLLNRRPYPNVQAQPLTHTDYPHMTSSIGLCCSSVNTFSAERLSWTISI